MTSLDYIVKLEASLGYIVRYYLKEKIKTNYGRLHWESDISQDLKEAKGKTKDKASKQEQSVGKLQKGVPGKFQEENEGGRVTEMELRKGKDRRGKGRNFQELYYIDYCKNFGSK